MITQTIKLNLIPGGILPRIKASQYDAGARTLVFKLYNGVQEFTIPTDSTVSIRGTKSDNTGFQYECEYSGSEVTAKITDQMTVSPGEVLAELVITKDDERIATGNFIFDNEEAALKDDVIISKTDIPAIERLDDIVDLVEEDAAKAEAAKTASETAATQASQSAQASVTSASQASTSAINAASSASEAATSESNAATSETNAGASATQASSSAAAALASQQAAAQSEENAAASEINAAASETNASDSATAASASATAAAESEANAADSETAAAGSAANAASLASQAAGSAANAASSESNAATSETNAGNSATQAESSAQTASTAAANASTSATNAATSETNAATSETLARKWAVGDSGSGTNVPSDTNNSYYWATVSEAAATGKLKREFVNTLPTTNIDTYTIYSVPASSPVSGNYRDEYMNTDGTTSGWDPIGSTQVDLSNYYTKTQVDASVQNAKDYADAQIAAHTPTVDGETILKDSNGVLHSNVVFYQTLAAAQAAAQAGDIPDKAIVYVNGGEQPGWYTKPEIDELLSEKLGANMQQSFTSTAEMTAAIQAGTVPSGATCYVGGNPKKIYKIDNGTAVDWSDASDRVPVYGKGINLLDNWYFVGGGSQQGGGQFPINQRNGYVVPPGVNYWNRGSGTAQGTTDTYYKVDIILGTDAVFTKDGIKYAAHINACSPGYVGAGYGIDRWKMNNNSSIIVCNPGYMHFETHYQYSWLVQGFERPLQIGQKYTVSILLANNKFLTSTFMAVDLTNQYILSILNDYYIEILKYDGTNAASGIAITQGAGTTEGVNYSLDIIAIKLELGTEQTLAHQDAQGNWVLNDPSPNFQQELAKCQRYYIKTSYPLTGYVLSNNSGTSGQARFDTDLAWRNFRLANVYNVPVTINSGVFYINGTTSLRIPENIRFDYLKDLGALIATGDFSAYSTGQFIMALYDVQIELSADL